MKPQWQFIRGDKLELLLTLKPLMEKAGYEGLTKEMVAALANDLLLCPEVLSGTESVSLLTAFSPLSATLPESLATLLEMATAQVINHCSSLDPSTLRPLQNLTNDELLKAIIEVELSKSQVHRG